MEIIELEFKRFWEYFFMRRLLVMRFEDNFGLDQSCRIIKMLYENIRNSWRIYSFCKLL